MIEIDERFKNLTVSKSMIPGDYYTVPSSMYDLFNYIVYNSSDFTIDYRDIWGL